MKKHTLNWYEKPAPLGQLALIDENDRLRAELAEAEEWKQRERRVRDLQEARIKKAEAQLARVRENAKAEIASIERTMGERTGYEACCEETAIGSFKEVLDWCRIAGEGE